MYLQSTEKQVTIRRSEREYALVIELKLLHGPNLIGNAATWTRFSVRIVFYSATGLICARIQGT